MKNSIIAALGFVAILACSCAKAPQTGINDAEIRHVESWVLYQKSIHKDYLWKETPLGCYILEEKEGTGALLGDATASPFALISYTATNLDGKIISCSGEDLARQLGTYKQYNYYGSSVIARGAGNSYAGEDEVLTGMRVGGTRKVMVPAWLLTTKRYKSIDDYKNSQGGTTSAIYTFTVEDTFSDVFKWQIDSIETFIKRNYPKASLDTTGKYGLYYYQITPPDDPDEVINTGDRLHLNYTGRLLNGTVFDSTDEIVSKDNGLEPKSAYEPTYITKGDKYSNTTMGESESEIIDGFAYAVDKMKHGEKAIAIFYSPWGYGAKGSGASIPPYSPLMFELEMVHKNQEPKN